MLGSLTFIARGIRKKRRQSLSYTGDDGSPMTTDVLKPVTSGSYVSPSGSTNLILTALTLLTAIASDSHGQTIVAQQCLITFAEKVEVPARHAGLVASVKVDVGDEVVAGTSLGRLNDTLTQKRYSVARTQAVAAKEESEDTTEEEFAKATLRELEQEYQDTAKLRDDNGSIVSQRELDRLKLSVERAKLEITRAQRRQRSAILSSEVRIAELATIHEQLKQHDFICPIDGVVLETNRRVGEWVSAGQAVIEVGKLSRVKLNAIVPASELMELTSISGALISVTVRLSGGGDTSPTLKGRLLSVDPQMLTGDRVRVHCEILNQRSGDSLQPWILYPGVPASLYLSSSPPQVGQRSAR
ncbi:MAG: HlyD family efflux transporter periplasmic adaptor subunit [Planctomycetota bacterium]